MELHEVDPTGDVIITLRNLETPFAVAHFPEANQEGPVTAAIETTAVTETRHRRKKYGRKGSREIVTAQDEAAPKTEPLLVEEVLVISEAPAFEEAAPAVEKAPAFEEAALVSDLEDWRGDDSGKRGTDRSLSEPPGIRLRVSSKHLTLASPYFATALNGPWREAAPASADLSRQIFAYDWDPEALLILMHIIHGRNRQVPRSIDLELLAKMAVLVDYYECYEAVELFVELWLQKLKGELPKQICRELILWLCVSWVFDDAGVFTSVTSVALRHSQGPLETLGLPIPESVVVAIDSRRQEAVETIVAAYQELLVSLRDGPETCSFECSSIELGALMKEMRAKRLEPKPEIPLLGYSVVATIATTRSIRSPTWDLMARDLFGGGYYREHSCDVRSHTQSKIDEVEKMMVGLTLDEWKGRRHVLRRHP